jgi:hypothetical protein
MEVVEFIIGAGIMPNPRLALLNLAELSISAPPPFFSPFAGGRSEGVAVSVAVGCAG